MSAFTDRLYASWLGVNGCQQRRRGYGAQPHGSEAKLRPINDRFSKPCPVAPYRPVSAVDATSRNGLQRANDAASRPEKQAVLTPRSALFLPSSEKSSINSKA